MIEDFDLPPLTPGQSGTLDQLNMLLPVSDVLYVAGSAGTGKSLVMRHLHARAGGRFLTATDGLRALNECPPAHLEEALVALIRRAFENADLVYFDDWWSMASFSLIEPDRPFFLQQTMTAVFAEIARSGKKFISSVPLGNEELFLGAVGAWVTIPPLGGRDKKAILDHHFGQEIADSAIETLERAYQGLNGYQLESLARLLRQHHSGPVEGADLVDLLESIIDGGNIVLADVEDVSVRNLIGVEAHIETLERTVLLPMMADGLARKMGIRPARGILLHGQPGTGKTTLGRLLAHRMKGKFFIIDGTMFSDRAEFPVRVGQLLNRAAACSPSVVFIDDADVIFRNGQARGFVRQLLTKLDGLANESQRDVCLVMTAMNLADLPPALIRSGRIDVWIELRLPDSAQRAAIVAGYARSAAVPRDFDGVAIAEICDAFSPADLRALVADASAAAAYDGQLGEPERSFDAYLVESAAEIIERKRRIGI